MTSLPIFRLRIYLTWGKGATPEESNRHFVSPRVSDLVENKISDVVCLDLLDKIASEMGNGLHHDYRLVA